MTYNVGIIGTGFGTKVHLPALQAHPDFEPIIIAGRNPEKTQQLAETNNIQWTTNWKDLVNNSELDLIAVSAPPYQHYRMGRKILKAGKHLLLEKPTTSNADQARELLVIANEMNLVGMLCHEFRWNPERMYLMELVQNKEYIGKLQEIHGSFYMGFAASSENPKFGWLWDSIYDGGILGAAGSHYADFIRSVTNLEFKEVYGRTYIRTPSRMTTSGKLTAQTADDGFVFEFSMQNGVNGTFDLSGTINPSPPSRLVFSGTEGTIYLEGTSIFAGKFGEQFKELHIPEKYNLDESLKEKDRRIPPFLKLLDQVSLALNKGESLTPSLYDGWKNQQVLDAVRLAEKTNSRINIVDYL